MQNLHLQFAYPWAPWLFFLLIPAFALTLISYFCSAKKYRRTRNRIISLILHTIVMTLAICVLTGMTFVYEIPNEENEIILLVDVSDTAAESEEQRDEFIYNLLRQRIYDGFRIGVVTFGFTQEYAVPLTYDIDTIYDAYLDAPLPDTSATDIESALDYTRTLFRNPETSKIVLISDGKETDGNASSVIRSIAWTDGIRVDTVYVDSHFEQDLVQVVDVEFPEYHINMDEECTILVSVWGKSDGEVTAELSDNGYTDPENGTQAVKIGGGAQQLSFRHTFSERGLHEIRVSLSVDGDGLTENNVYHAYYYLDVYDRILVIEQYDQSDKLMELLQSEEGGYDVDLINLDSVLLEDFPQTVDDLRNYDQIILNNVANSDLPEGFVDNLYKYVNDYGGGLFTIGGDDEEGNAHAYNRADLNKTTLQQMLPVEAINYTPPVGVAVVIDISLSMTSEAKSGGGTKLFWAQQGAVACLDALTERDFIGVFTLDDKYGTILNMTRRTDELLIREAINREIESDGGTWYTLAIRRAAQAVLDETRVDKRHVVIITDGEPSKEDTDYLHWVESYHESGITFSTVFIEGSGSSGGGEAQRVLEEIAERGGGRNYVSSGDELLKQMRDDLNAPEIKEQEERDFIPEATNVLSPVFHGVELNNVGSRSLLSVNLKGFYGVKERQRAETLLIGDYEVPIYAQWKFGEGMVGSFMCDLNGKWSQEFLSAENSRKFLLNVINNLMPTQDIQPKEIALELEEQNYTNHLLVRTTLEEGETLRGELINVDTGESVSLTQLPDPETPLGELYTLSPLTSTGSSSFRCSFIIKSGGTYRVTFSKIASDGTVKENTSVDLYKAFPYSEEYAEPEEDFDGAAFLSSLAEHGNGALVADNTDPWEIFENFVTSIVKTFDPRWLFIGTVIVLFLLDIAVRKFKFKWPHEIIRERREGNTK